MEEANVARALDIVVPYITSSRLSSSPCSWKHRRRRTISFARKNFPCAREFSHVVCKNKKKRKEKTRLFLSRATSLAYLSRTGLLTRIRRLLYLSALSVGDTRVSLSGALSVGAFRDTCATDGERDGGNITPGYSREQGATVRVLPNPGKITA